MVPDDEKYGVEIRVQRRGLEVRLVFIVAERQRAMELEAEVRHQLKVGVLYLAVTGVPKEEKP